MFSVSNMYEMKSDVPGAVQYAYRPEATSLSANAVQGGKRSSPKEFGGHVPVRACGESVSIRCPAISHD